MNIVPLTTRRHLIPTIAESLHHEWSEFEPWSAPDLIAARFESASGGAKFPYCLVAISDSDEFLGTASVKLNEVPSHPHKLHWLGEVFVLKQYRGRGIATLLIQRIADYAFKSGANCLYLYTPDQQKFYEKLGWRPCCEDVVNSEVVTIMVRQPDVWTSDLPLRID